MNNKLFYETVHPSEIAERICKGLIDFDEAKEAMSENRNRWKRVLNYIAFTDVSAEIADTPHAELIQMLNEMESIEKPTVMMTITANAIRHRLEIMESEDDQDRS